MKSETIFQTTKHTDLVYRISEIRILIELLTCTKEILESNPMPIFCYVARWTDVIF